MTPDELAKACNRQDAMVVADFPSLVQASFGIIGVFQRDLAREFEVAESTVSRWAKGTARPHPRIQRLVLAWIAKRATKLAKAHQQQPITT